MALLCMLQLNLIYKVEILLSQNAENSTHIKGRLLYQAMILYNYVPLQNGIFSSRKEFSPRGSEFFPLRAVPKVIENHFTTFS